MACRPWLASRRSWAGGASWSRMLNCRVLPECGGRTRDAKDDIRGAPELVVEVAKGTRYVDLGPKKADYERAGVQEYIVPRDRPGRDLLVRSGTGRAGAAIDRSRWVVSLDRLSRTLARSGRTPEGRSASAACYDRPGLHHARACRVRRAAGRRPKVIARREEVGVQRGPQRQCRRQCQRRRHRADHRGQGQGRARALPWEPELPLRGGKPRDVKTGAPRFTISFFLQFFYLLPRSRLRKASTPKTRARCI